MSACLLTLCLSSSACRTAGHAQTGVETTTLTATVGGRSITATLEGAASEAHARVLSEADAAVFEFGGHRVTVTRDQVVVDETNRTFIPAGTRRVRLNVARGWLSVTADDDEILLSRL
jgi:hypothetical protein